MTYTVSAPTLAGMLATAFVVGLFLGFLRGRTWMLERIKRELATRRAVFGSVRDTHAPPATNQPGPTAIATVHQLHPERDA